MRIQSKCKSCAYLVTLRISEGSPIRSEDEEGYEKKVCRRAPVTQHDIECVLDCSEYLAKEEK